MNKYFNALTFAFGSILLLTLIITILNYIELLSNNLYKILMLLIPIISLLIGGFIIGRKSHTKGYIEGLKLGLITLIIFTFFGIITKTKFDFSNLIHFATILMSSIIGSMIGINYKTK